MAETKRLFVAAPISTTLKEILRTSQSQYTHDVIRFVPEDNLHITIHFLGEVHADQVGEIEEKLQQIAATQVAFTLRLEALEPGPKPRSPRLIWARFTSHPEFTQLSSSVSKHLAIRPPDHPDYIPHITVARFRKDKPRPVSLPTILFKEEQIELPVSSLALWQSELKSPHPVYRILREFTLTGSTP